MNAINEDIIKSKNLDLCRIYCPYCNHTNHIPVFLDSKLCGWCKRKIVNNTKEHFKYKIRKELNKTNEK